MLATPKQSTIKEVKKSNTKPDIDIDEYLEQVRLRVMERVTQNTRKLS